MMYKLVIPSKQQDITIGMQYGSVTIKNGQIVPDSDIVRLFPDYFVPIPEDKPAPVKLETPVETPVLETPLKMTAPTEPPKRKAGRPFKQK
jgi:hypothetical protein